jgi:1,4-dihydroxy-6-naphthoate synthase
MNALTIAVSPCPNDSFIFGAWALGHVPSPAGRSCRFFWHDVQELNQGASADTWDLTKVSAAVALRLEDTHTILSCGGAFGLEHGPKLVVRKGWKKTPRTIAVPGLDTTAMLLLKNALGYDFTPVPMIFDSIVQAVRTGRVDAGLLIHETALIYDRHELELRLDLGAWWREYTHGLPLPLGCIVIRRALGETLRVAAEESIRTSILQARKHPDRIRPFTAALAQELDSAVLDQHIAAYVNDFSLDMGRDGLTALNRLLKISSRAGCSKILLTRRACAQNG